MKATLFASALLTAGGFILIGLGLYFIFLRPALLPEDLRSIEASLAQIQSTLPELQTWLSRVFSVLGGYMIATGLLTIHVAATNFRSESQQAIAVVCVSGVASIGWMVVNNFMINSDFKWMLVVFSLPWIGAFLLFWIGKRHLLASK